VIQDRKRLEEAIGITTASTALTDDLDTLFELARKAKPLTAKSHRR